VLLSVPGPVHLRDFCTFDSYRPDVRGNDVVDDLGYRKADVHASGVKGLDLSAGAGVTREADA
jgi:hypothetical protein